MTCIRLLLDSEFSPFEVFTFRLIFFQQKIFSIATCGGVIRRVSLQGSHTCCVTDLHMNFLRSFYFSYQKYFLLSLSSHYLQPPRSVLSPLALAQHHSGFSDSTEHEQRELWVRFGGSGGEVLVTGRTSPRSVTQALGTFGAHRACPLQTDRSCSQGNKLPALGTKRRPKGGRQFINCTQENVLICPLLFRLYLGTLSLLPKNMWNW